MIPLVIAHRGASGYAPENTAVAIKKALQMRVNAIELDVQLTKDKELVVFHDYTLKRITGKKVYVKDYNLEQLKTMDYGGWFGKGFAGERIITLAEAFKIINNKRTLFIDVKDKEPRDPKLITTLLIEQIKKSSFKRQITITSENHRVDPFLNKEIKKQKLKNVKMGFLHYTHTNPFKQRKKLNYSSLHTNFWLTTKKLVRKAHERGLLVFPWAPTKKKIMKKLIKWRVDGIITSYPDRLQKVINAINKSSSKKS